MFIRAMVNLMYGNLRKLDKVPIGVVWIPEHGYSVNGEADFSSENAVTETIDSAKPKRGKQIEESDVKPHIVSQTSVMAEDESLAENPTKTGTVSKTVNKAKNKRKSADTKKNRQQ